MAGHARATEAVATAGSDPVRPGSVLALDIGGTKLAAGVVDADGTLRGFVVAPTENARGREDVLARLFALGRRAVREAGAPWDAVQAVGIGCGGPLDSDAGLL